jgi:hypothetical protein
VTTDPEVAKRLGMEEERDYLDDGKDDNEDDDETPDVST